MMIFYKAPNIEYFNMENISKLKTSNKFLKIILKIQLHSG